MSIIIHCHQAARAKAERNAELLRRFGGTPVAGSVVFHARCVVGYVPRRSGLEPTRGICYVGHQVRRKKGGYNAIVPHSPEELEYCKQQAAQLPEDTILVGMVPEAARKAFILITGIVWEGDVPAQKYYEVPV